VRRLYTEVTLISILAVFIYEFMRESVTNDMIGNI